MNPVHTLYVCYFGLREPLVQTQVLSYLRQLKSDSLRVSLLTFEPRLHQAWSKQQLAEQRAALASEGITWHYLPYHKSPSLPATCHRAARTMLRAWVRAERLLGSQHWSIADPVRTFNRESFEHKRSDAPRRDSGRARCDLSPWAGRRRATRLRAASP